MPLHDVTYELSVVEELNILHVRLVPGAVDPQDGGSRSVTLPGFEVHIDSGANTVTVLTEDGQVWDREIQAWAPKEDGGWHGARELLYAHYYGMGERTGPLDKRGSRHVLWNTDASTMHSDLTPFLYQSHPWWLGYDPNTNQWLGWFLDNASRVTFDFGQTTPDALEIDVDAGDLSYYLIPGKNPQDVLTRYTGLTGRMPMMPKWVLGNHQSRWSYLNSKETLEVAKKMREHRIPCDVLYLDIDYMDGFRVFTWDPVRFPDPVGLIETLHHKGFRVVAIVDPGVKQDGHYPVYQTAVARDVLVKNPQEENFVGKVWPGDVVFPDFFDQRTKVWWQENVQQFVASGLDGLWNDMNEPAVWGGPGGTMPGDLIHRTDNGPMPHRVLHNRYGMEMAQASFAGMLEARPHHRPFILTRAGFSGVQRYAASWTGDNHSHFTALAGMIPMLLNLGLSGQAMVGADVGGFQGDAQEELMVRWTAAAALTPYFRNHAAKGTRAQEPWQFGAEALSYIRDFIERRYQLLPYLYALMVEASQKGYPMMRPLIYAFPNDPEVRQIADQFMVGNDLLVAPIVTAQTTHRAVYFPSGVWSHYDDGQPLKEGWHVIDLPLGRFPVFVRRGAILVRQPVGLHTGEDEKQREWLIYAEDEGQTHWYEDDGLSMNYLNGQYRSETLRYTLRDGQLRVVTTPQHRGYDAQFTVTIRVVEGSHPVNQIFFNGQKLDMVRQDGRLESASFRV